MGHAQRMHRAHTSPRWHQRALEPELSSVLRTSRSHSPEVKGEGVLLLLLPFILSCFIIIIWDRCVPSWLRASQQVLASAQRGWAAGFIGAEPNSSALFTGKLKTAFKINNI